MKNFLKIFLSFALLFFLYSCSSEEVNTGVNEVSDIASTTEMIDENETIEVPSLRITDIIPQISESLMGSTQFNSCVISSIDTCVNEVSYGNGNLPNCDDYFVESNRMSCEENKIIVQAKESKDIKLCENLQYNKENCEYEIALTIGFEDFNTDVCDIVSEGYTIQCNNEIIMHEAKTKKDLQICTQMISYSDGENNFEKDFCEEEVTFIIEDEKRLEEELQQQENLENLSSSGIPLGEE